MPLVTVPAQIFSSGVTVAELAPYINPQQWSLICSQMRVSFNADTQF
jgi:hypothetical protein